MRGTLFLSLFLRQGSLVCLFGLKPGTLSLVIQVASCWPFLTSAWVFLLLFFGLYLYIYIYIYIHSVRFLRPCKETKGRRRQKSWSSKDRTVYQHIQQRAASLLQEAEGSARGKKMALTFYGGRELRNEQLVVSWDPCFSPGVSCS